MNYEYHYKTLIDRAYNRETPGYTESHHIIPRCMGGMDNSTNLVNLTPEEHYVAHQLLVKIHPNEHKLIYAAMMMCANRKGNKVYGWLRRKLSVIQKINSSGHLNSQYGKRWINKNDKAIKIKFEQLDVFLSDGWVIGRTKKQPAPIIVKMCGINSKKYNWILTEEEQILLEFDTHNSISKILAKRGFIKKEGNSILSKWLKSKGRIPLKRRNTAEVA